MLALTLVLATGSPAFGAGKAAKVKYTDFLKVKPAELSGKISYADGKTAGKGLPVRVWRSSLKKFVHTSATDKAGAYKIPKLDADRYLVVFGDRVCVDLRVDEAAKQTVRPLDVVIPRGKALAAPVYTAAGFEAAGMGTKIGLIGGGLGVTGGSAIWIIENNTGKRTGDSGHVPEKPKTTSTRSSSRRSSSSRRRAPVSPSSP